MTPLILSLADLRADAAPSVGGKAAALGGLAAAGFPVPPGVCVTTAAFALALAPYQDRLAALLRARDLADPAQAADAAAGISELLGDLAIPEAVACALRQALPAVAGEGAAVAVRSSATDEDGAEVSFAGQYETVLGVRGEAAVAAAVLTCWRSCFSANALAARAAAGREAASAAMAVLIQRMVAAECAGVCFTKDPVRPEADQLVVNAAWGLGAGAVDGSVATDTYWLPREEPRRVAERRVVAKPERWALAPTGGVQRQPVEDEQVRAACLPEPWLQRVVEFALAAEVLLGRPQDVEWAIADQQVWLLQSRPITALPAAHSRSWDFPVAWADAADQRMLWRRYDSDRAELPPPLDLDVSAAFCLAQADALPISVWPGAPRERVFNGRRFGGWGPSSFSPGDVRIRKKAKADLVIRLRAEGKTIWDHWAPEIRSAVARLHAFDASSAAGQTLAEHLEDAFGAFRRHWMIHWCPWSDDREADPLLRAFEAMTGQEGDAARLALAPLVEGEETIHTRLIDGLYALAQTAAATPALAALVGAPPPDAWRQIEVLPEAAAFRAQMATFLEQYGDHMGMGYGSSSSFRRPTWRQEPAQVLALLAPYLRPGVEPPAAARTRARAERDARVEALCAGADPEKAAEFRRWLPAGRREATLLEEHNYWIDQTAYGQLRNAVGYAAHWLVGRGGLAAEDDIFWLTMAEITTALRSDAPASHAALIAERQAEAAARRAQTPPPLLGVPAARLDPRPPLKDEVTPAETTDAGTLRGVGASAGRRRGRARVVQMTEATPAVEPGDVLVAVNAGPAWTPLFPLLGGLVLDEGSFGQHGATTAREYGVPAVITTRDATRRIPAGAWVIVDGTAGTVEIERDGVP